MEEGIEKLLELAVGQGIWAALYIYLFFRLYNKSWGVTPKGKTK